MSITSKELACNLVRYVVVVSILLSMGYLEGAAAAWSVQRSVHESSSQAICYLESDRQTIKDGYDQTQARLVVGADTIQVVSEAPLDAEFNDIALQVDHRPIISIDALVGKKRAQFTPYDDLVNSFKKGRKVRAQLRFWPTWPATSSHSAVFSLRGFSKAYGMMQRCEP